ncbi:DEAD/DEAH box helicase [Pleomorphomonas sp. JP5]|uniref:DEAD/DEAH box helicase n=1 Tax=Pleomorphomonas sp. JP5 TaxID=2942998 RepID=UPI00204365A3|nr:DEAD/DEAH box helicase family protein [Pleomorphomonas sp. JP5]MCM5560289.1 DEAD/DEAH box helicase family protein [Pleomorphomonas sp. JP5]
MSVEADTIASRMSLAGYQQQAVDGLQSTIRRVAGYHHQEPQHRQRIARQAGVMLLQSPTGSGKTLVLGRTLEGLRGAIIGKVVWFWFAPYAGLVSQTRDALAAQCGSLRLRDVYVDREPTQARDGDVFIQTWASLAARNAASRKVRRTTERAMSFDDMLKELRGQGFNIGVVIDEAHLNFGTNAAAAAQLYLEVLAPDYTILATATPNDDKLEQFEAKAELTVATRIVVDRAQVVEAGLNKAGLMLGVLRFRDGDEKLIDIEQATLTAAWNQHCLVKDELARHDLGLVPLMLVQVEDQAKGAEDPIKRVRDKLEQIGVPTAAIKSHTSGEPDPEFHTLAYDPAVEVLVFKVAVATGFDAPRAWTLVSVRPNRGKEFGLQIVGRIMRVHPLVRPIHGEVPLFDRGYVFLSDPELQGGLAAAVDDLKAVRQSMELLTDRLDIIEFGNSEDALEGAIDRQSTMPAPRPPQSDEERRTRLDSLVAAGVVHQSVMALSVVEQDRAIVTGEMTQGLNSTPLFGHLPEMMAPTSFHPVSVQAGNNGPRRYRLRRELGVPEALYREELPPIHGIEGQLVIEIAREFCRDDLLAELTARRRRADLSLKELFRNEAEEHRSIQIRLSDVRVAEQAQQAFEFNDGIDPRALKRALYDRLAMMADDRGIDGISQSDIRRAIDIAVMRDPGKLKDAVRAALVPFITLNNDLPIPLETDPWPRNLEPAEKGAYGVFPEHMNQEEIAFARVLDADDSGKVLWWLRNPENVKWATKLILPNGRRFYPDFAVGIRGRSTKDAIALVEVKDDGETGRLQSDNNTLKIRVQHREYQKVCWVFRTSDKKWVRASYAERLGRIVEQDRFEIDDLVFIE